MSTYEKRHDRQVSNSEKNSLVLTFFNFINALHNVSLLIENINYS